MLVIRLQRLGKKGQPHFRIVLQEHTHAVKRKAQEVLGYYKPATDPKEFKVDQERVKYWISMGAKPSDSLAGLLKRDGMEDMDQYIGPRDKKGKKKGEQPEDSASEASTPAAETPAAEAPKEETPAEEAPKEEAPKEEAPKEETPAPAEETPAAEEPKSE